MVDTGGSVLVTGGGVMGTLAIVCVRVGNVFVYQ